MAGFTQEAIRTTFLKLLEEKPFDKITVKDIVEECGINRNTFYYHYHDIYEVIDDIFDESRKRAIAAAGTGQTMYDEIDSGTAMILEKKKTLAHICNSRNRAGLRDTLESGIRSTMAVYVMRDSEGTGLTEEGIEYIAGFYSCAFAGNVLRWVDRGMPGESRGLLLKLVESYRATVKDMIADYLARPME